MAPHSWAGKRRILLAKEQIKLNKAIGKTGWEEGMGVKPVGWDGVAI